MAAMLLLSVNVSAQTKKAAKTKAVKTEKTVKKTTPNKAPATTPLKGDVNGDGVVDVADIAAIIAIMKNGGGTGEGLYKYYLGVVSDENIQNQTYINNLITSSSSTSDSPLTSITLPSGASSNNGYEHIFIYPASWGTPSVINRATTAPVGLSPLSEAGINNPSGYGAFFLGDPKSNAGSIYDITWKK